MSQKKQARKSQVRKQTQQKSNTFEFGVFDLAVPQSVEEPQDISRVLTKYIPFGKNAYKDDKYNSITNKDLY